MRVLNTVLSSVAILTCGACATGSVGGAPSPTAAPGTLAQIYYWRAKPGKFDEYTRFIREHAEPIDGDAGRRGAFVSVTTYMTRDPASPWTHMRVFVLRDSTQLAGLGDALTAAGIRAEPDSVKRRQASEYSAGLREAAGSATVAILGGAR